MVDASDGITPETGEAGNTGYLSKNGSAPAATTNSLVAVDATNQKGLYYIELESDELDEYGFIVFSYKSANTAEFQAIGQVVDFDPYEPLSGQSNSFVKYPLIREIFQDEVRGIADREKTSLKPIMKKLQGIEKRVKGIKMPKFDDSRILKDIARLKKDIASIDIPEVPPFPEIPEPEKVDLQPIEDQLKEVIDSVVTISRTVNDDELVKTIVLAISQALESLPMLGVNLTPQAQEVVKETKQKRGRRKFGQDILTRMNNDNGSS